MTGPTTVTGQDLNPWPLSLQESDLQTNPPGFLYFCSDIKINVYLVYDDFEFNMHISMYQINILKWNMCLLHLYIYWLNWPGESVHAVEDCIYVQNKNHCNNELVLNTWAVELDYSGSNHWQIIHNLYTTLSWFHGFFGYLLSKTYLKKIKRIAILILIFTPLNKPVFMIKSCTMCELFHQLYTF